MPESALGGDALPARDRDVEREQDDRRRVDRHRRRHAIERNAVEQLRHVVDRVDGDADAADLAGGERVIGVVAHLRRQIEGDAQAADALREQVPIPRFDSAAVPNPAYCRIVQSRPRYIVGWMPRLRGRIAADQGILPIGGSVIINNPQKPQDIAALAIDTRYGGVYNETAFPRCKSFTMNKFGADPCRPPPGGSR